MTQVIITENNHFELHVDDAVAVIEFDKLEPNILDLIHTKVPNQLEGRGVGSQLVAGALQYCKENGLNVIPSCSFIKNYIDNHPEWIALVSQK